MLMVCIPIPENQHCSESFHLQGATRFWSKYITSICSFYVVQSAIARGKLPYCNVCINIYIPSRSTSFKTNRPNEY